MTFALEQPDLCNLPAIYDLVCLPAIDLVQFLLDNSRLKFIHKRLRILREDIVQKAGKQLHWKLEVLTEALEPFERRTELGRSLLNASYDPAELKSRPTTLYLIVPGASIEGYASYISCVLTSLVAQLAEAPGKQKVLFLIDECSQLPPIKFGKWVRLHRKDGLSFWTFWQSTSSVRATYSKAEADDLFESCAVKQYLGVDEIEVARRLSEKAGTTTVFGHSMNRGGDGRSAQDSNAEIEKKVLPVSRILNLGLDEQIIEMTGVPLILAKRYPWWEIEPFCDRLNHFSDMADEERYPEDDDNLFDEDFLDLDEEAFADGDEGLNEDDEDLGDDE